MVSHPNLNAFWSILQCCKKISSKVHVETIVRDCSVFLIGFTYKEKRLQRNLEPQTGSAVKSTGISQHLLVRSHNFIFQSKWKHNQCEILPHVRGAPACFSTEVVKMAPASTFHQRGLIHPLSISPAENPTYPRQMQQPVQVGITPCALPCRGSGA